MTLQRMDALYNWLKALSLMLITTACSLGHASQVAFVSHAIVPSVEQLAKRTSERTGIEILQIKAGAAVNWSDYSACIIIGPQALDSTADCGGKPMIAVFITHDTALQRKDLASALFLEPPLPRQVQLARAILGDDRPFGILVEDRNQWRNLITRPDPLVTPYFTDQYPSLNHALIALLRDSHALIGIYDTKLYSSENIKNILITAYRQNKPLIGPSSAYIKAGALATTYSDLDDVARRLSEILLTGLHENVWPEPGYNPYFKVRYNLQVGRSLNLLLPDADKLAQKLADEEHRP